MWSLWKTHSRVFQDAVGRLPVHGIDSVHTETQRHELRKDALKFPPLDGRLPSYTAAIRHSVCHSWPRPLILVRVHRNRNRSPLG